MTSRSDGGAEELQQDADVLIEGLEADSSIQTEGGESLDGSMTVADPALDGATDSEQDAAPVSQYCGDGIRDPVKEECDDGPGMGDDVCNASCRATAAWVEAVPAPRAWGSAGNLLAGNASQVGVVHVVQELFRSVWLSRFDPSGRPLSGAVRLDTQDYANSDPAPQVVSIPDGRLVVVWTDSAGPSPNVVLREVDATGALSDARIASSDSSGPQQDPAVVWTGSELVIAWSELGGIEQRRFNSALSPLSADTPLDGMDTVDSNVRLCRIATGHAAAWRSFKDSSQRIRVRVGGQEWQSQEIFAPASEGERPAVTSLDDTTLLVVFTVGAAANAAGPEMRWGLVSLTDQSDFATYPLSAIHAELGGTMMARESAPQVVAVGGHVWLLWQRSDAVGASGIRSAELAFGAADRRLQLVSSSLSFPGVAHTPVLGVGEATGKPALLIGWGSERDHGPADLRWIVRPLPWVQLEPLAE